MKVEFDGQEVWAMMNSVLDQLIELDMDSKDRAALRRWRSAEMTPGSPSTKLLVEKMNRDIQGAHDRSEPSPIKKPDWV